MKSAKINLATTAVIFITALGFLSPCYAESSGDRTSINQVKQETQELLQTLKAYSADQRDEAIDKTRAALDNLDKRIDALETRIDNDWDNMNKAAREKARASLKSLRQQRIQLAEKYGNLETSSDEAWEHMKKGFSKAYNAVNKAWEKAKREFESAQ